MDSNVRGLSDLGRAVTSEELILRVLSYDDKVLLADPDGVVDAGLLEVEEHDGVLSSPYPRLSNCGVVLMTILLAAVATPLCWFMATAIALGNGPGPKPWATQYVPLAIWFLAVLGPATFYYCVPHGWWYPAYWLQHDGEQKTLSYNSGFYTWKQGDIVCLLSLSASQGKARRRATELQVVVGKHPPLSRYAIARTSIGDPVHAFGYVAHRYCRALQVPGFFVTMEPDGSHTLIRLDDLDEQSVAARRK